MHLAVCDDNIADRKQTERLLGRQSDRIFKETGERLYIDSYGNVEAYLQHPQMYNAHFIDMKGEVNGFEIAKKLIEIGITKPIILCPSDIDYRALYEESGLDADNILFLNKPIRVAELTEMMGTIKKMNGTAVPTLELRGQDETIYAKGDDIICVIRKKSELLIHLTDNRQIIVIDDIYNFYDQCAIFPQICPVSDNGLININHISSQNLIKVKMDNGVSLGISFTYRNSIKEAREYTK